MWHPGAGTEAQAETMTKTQEHILTTNIWSFTSMNDYAEGIKMGRVTMLMQTKNRFCFLLTFHPDITASSMD